MTRGFLVAAALIIAQHGAAAAFPEDPGTAAVTILPAGGHARGIQLKAQTVDAIIEDHDGAAWADTTVWLLLYNPNSKPITVTVSLPGPQLSPGELPSDLKLSLGSQELPTTPLAAPEGAGPQLTADVRVPRRGSVELRATYRQALPDIGGIAAFSYMMETAKQWAGSPESLRITVHLKTPITHAQLLDVVPPPKYVDGDTISWSWEGERGLTNVAMALIPPSRWSALQAAGTSAESASAEPSQHLALAEQYLALAELPPFPFEGSGFRHRFLLGAIGELQTAVSGPSSDVAAQLLARQKLAGLSRIQSQVASDNSSEVQLQDAAKEIGRGLELDPAHPELIAMAREVYTKLADLMQRRGEAVAAAEYSARLAALDPTSAAKPGLEQLSEAEAALRRGDISSARGLIAALTSTDLADRPAAPAARVQECRIVVTTRSGGRSISMALGGGLSEAKDAQDIIKRSIALLQGISGATVRASDTDLEISLPVGQVPQ